MAIGGVVVVEQGQECAIGGSRAEDGRVHSGEETVGQMDHKVRRGESVE